ncbi:hypothetical protein CTAYLR_002087 [Chrysophaeum taylorii]|uniref:DH domain-containing protein n=1 Tax=Chrysophaeum taylorii TaxID=2483200 RepID=A0AAD7UND6_9STRA|nr:hypothetical protein CTAYLR_002087 [Chrysophaeum taylorii]
MIETEVGLERQALAERMARLQKERKRSPEPVRLSVHDPLASEVESERRRVAERVARLGRRQDDEERMEAAETSWFRFGPSRKIRRSVSTPPVMAKERERLLCYDLFALEEAEEEFGYEVGAAVEARWQSGPIYYRGKIAATSRDGSTFTVAYDDGSVESEVGLANVRPLAAGARSRSREEIRREMRKFYERHNPAKLPHVDALLDRCGAGNEEALLEAIERKYENQPVMTPIASVAIEVAHQAVLAASKAAARAEIFAIYAAKKPAKIREVDALLSRSGGSEAELLAAVKCKYLPPSKTRVSKAFLTRANVVREIARSEDEFALRLRTLDERIAQPLRRKTDTPRVAPEQRFFVQDVLKLVAECEGLSQLSQKLRADLDAQLPRPRRLLSTGAVDRGHRLSLDDDSDLLYECRAGYVFRRFGPFFKMFAAYARRFQETVQARAFLSSLLDDDDLDVSGALSAPVERLRDYARLLGELVRLTPADHVDAKDAELAVDAVQDALRHVDQTLQGDVAFKRLVQILEPESLGSLLDVPTRKLLKEGQLEEIRYGATGGRVGVRPVRALALSDRLLLVARRPSSTKQQQQQQQQQQSSSSARALLDRQRQELSRRRSFIFSTNSSPPTSKSKQLLADATKETKGRLLHDLAYDEISAIEPCDDSVAYSTRHLDESKLEDVDCDDDDTLLFDDNDDDTLFRIETTVGRVVVLRADSPRAKNAWLGTLADLRDEVANLPRAFDTHKNYHRNSSTSSSTRPPLLQRRNSESNATHHARAKASTLFGFVPSSTTAISFSSRRTLFDAAP